MERKEMKMRKYSGKGTSARRGKRWFALLLCLCLIGTTVPATARAEEPTSGDQADVNAAKSQIENRTWTVEQGTANTSTGVKNWIERQLGTMNLNGVAYMVSELRSFTEATAGTAGDTDGTNGGFAFDVFLSKGESDTYAYAEICGVTGTITATAYRNGGGSGNPGNSGSGSGSSRRHSGGCGQEQFHRCGVSIRK